MPEDAGFDAVEMWFSTDKDLDSLAKALADTGVQLTSLLAGIVVSNAILLVDFTNQARREGLSRNEALLQAGIMLGLYLAFLETGQLSWIPLFEQLPINVDAVSGTAFMICLLLLGGAAVHPRGPYCRAALVDGGRLSAAGIPEASRLSTAAFSAGMEYVTWSGLWPGVPMTSRRLECTKSSSLGRGKRTPGSSGGRRS